MTLQQARQIFLKRYNEFAVDLAGLFINELEAQGHRATGKLIASVVAKVNATLNDIDVALSHLDYGIIVNSGVLASRVPFSRGSGAKTSQFIQALMAWIRVKGFAGGLEKNVRSAAFAIATKMKKEGIPTRGSYRVAGNGRRTMWIDYIYNKYQVEWQDQIEVISGDYVENSLDAMLEATARKYSPFIEFTKN